MSEIEDVRVFTGGMDLESHDSAIAANDYRQAWNCRNMTTQGQSAGALQNMYGNKLMQSSFLPVGTNVIIGACKDEPNHSVIFFLYNNDGGGRHGIYEYIPRTDTVVKILEEETVLNFHLDHRITHSNVIGDLIYWTDGYNPPRKINKLKAIAYTNATGTADYDAYTAITAQILDVIKYPPLLPPAVAYGTDVNYKNNSLQGALYQMCYRYVYDDYEYSVTSPISKNALPEGGIDSFGNVVLSQFSNNFITVPINTGPDEVRAIDVIVREGAAGFFKRVDRLRKYDDDYNQVYTKVTVTEYVDGAPYYLTVPEEFIKSVFIGMFLKPSDNIDAGTYVVDIVYSLNRIIINKTPLATPASGIEEFYYKTNTEVKYRFYNDRVGEVMDQDDVLRLYDTVPLLSGCQELIEGNKLLYSDITEGFDSTEIDVSLSHSVEEIGSNEGAEVVLEMIEWDSPNPAQPNLNGFYLVINDDDYKQFSRFIIKFTIIWEPSGANTSHDVNVSFIATDSTAEDFRTSFAAFLISLSIETEPGVFHSFMEVTANVSVIGINEGDPVIWINSYPSGSTHETTFDFNENYSLSYTSYIVSEPSWKAGVVQEFGIVYCDKGKRNGAVLTSELAKIYIPLFSELGDTDEKYYHDKRIIGWTIKHLPPDWAESYKWVFAPKTVLRTQYWITSIEPAESTVLDPPVVDDETQTEGIFAQLLIDVNSGIANVQKSNPDFVVPQYVFEKGDRIRFISNAYPAVDPSDPIADRQRYIQTNLDFAIKGTDAANKIIIELFDYEGYGVNKLSVVEIYRQPKFLGSENQSTFFYEFDEDYDIYEIAGVKYHRGGVSGVDQTASVDATGEFRGGDIYIKKRIDPSKAIGAIPDSAKTNTFPVEEQNFSDYYASDVHSLGNVFLPDSKMRRLRYTTGIRFSDVYFEGGINGLSTFRAKNFDRLNEKYGPINRVIQIGYTVKFFQTAKTVSVYNERGELSQAIGTGQLSVLIDQTLGSKQTPEVSYGTTNPESVVKVERAVYFYDRINQAIIRDDANGPDSITNVQMRSYMATLTKSFGNSDVRCYAVEDSQHGDIYFSFQYKTTRTHIATLVYNIYDQRWKTFVDLYDVKNFGMDCGIDCDSQMVTFMHGKVYVHNDADENRCTFYDIKYRQRVKFVANINPGTNKSFRYIQIGCATPMDDTMWEALEDGSIYIAPNDMYPLGQWSRLRKERFELKEGLYYAPFMMNSRTNRNFDTIQDLFNGDRLVGRWIQIDLSNASDNDSALEFVKVISDVSRKPV